ncbi:MAG TPA: hypothetical protein VD735_03880 [Candidatus Saccharimonadales bacterium]|nr:hypothetical protein [Candidatus Saccharimonadales bacterium]
MSILKRCAGAIGVALLPVMLFTFGSLVSTYQVLGSPQPVKQALTESGLYEAATSQAISAALQNAGSTSDSALGRPEVQKIITDALPADVVQQKTEGVVDSTYDWIQGDTERLQFALNLDSTKASIADGMATYADQYLSALPTCTTTDTTALTQPLEATCLPPNFDKTLATQQVKDEILNNQDFLNNSTLTAQDLTNNQGQALDQQLRAVPAVYEQVKWGVYITGALAVLCAVAAIWCAANLRSGLKRAGIIALVVGSVSALAAWGIGKGLQVLITKLSEPASDARLQSSLLDAVRILTQDVRNWWVAYGLVLAGLGIAALIGIRFMRPSSQALTQQLAGEVTAPNGATPPSVPMPDPADSKDPPIYRNGPKVQ